MQGAELTRPLCGHDNIVVCCAFSPISNSLLASGSYDESIRLWDARSGKAVRAIGGHSDPVTSVVFNASGTHLATSSYDGLVRIWDVASGQLLRTIQYDGTPPVTNVCYSPNSRYLLVSTVDGYHRLWDIYSGTLGSGSVPPQTKVVKAYSGHSGRHLAAKACFSVTSGRQYVVSGSEDGRVCMWNSGDRQLVHSLNMDAVARQRKAEGAAAAAKSTVGEGKPAAAGFKRSRKERASSTAPGPFTASSNGSGSASNSSMPWSRTLCGPIVAVATHPSRSVIAAGESAGSCAVRIWQDKA